MGLISQAAGIGAGIAAKKVADDVIDNEGKDKSLLKSAATLGAGVLVYKKVEDALDGEDNGKKDKNGSFLGGAAMGAGAVLAGNAIKNRFDGDDQERDIHEQMKADMKADMKQEDNTLDTAKQVNYQEQMMGKQESAFEKEKQKDPTYKMQSSFEQAVNEQSDYLQMNAAQKGLANQQQLESPELEV